MTDSGFSGLPPGPPPGSAGGNAPARADRGDVLKVVETTAALRHVARAQRIAGEIIAANRDGTLTIATTAGDVTVAKPVGRPDLVVGARVDIEIPPGNPPRQVILRAVELPAPPPAPIINDAGAARFEAPPETPVVTAPARAPVNIPEQPPAPPAATRPAPVTPEQVVRLLPLPPEQAAQIVRPPAEIIDTSLPPAAQAAALKMELIARLLPAQLDAAQLRELLPVAVAVLENAAAQLAQTILPRLPASSYAAPAALPPNALPPAAQAVAENLVATLQNLNAPPAAGGNGNGGAPAPALIYPLQLRAAPPGIPAAGTTLPAAHITLLPIGLPPATRAFVMAAPENFIHAVGAAPPLAAGAPAPVAGGMIAPKMDAQIIAIVPPAVKFVAPVPSSGTPGPPPGAALATPAPLAAALDGVAGALTATVRGITPQNMPVLSVSFPALGAVQDFVMQFPADNMPPGAAVTVLPRPGAPAPHAAALLPAITPLPDLFAPGLWPALDEAFQALRHAAPQAAQVMAHSVLPNAAAPARLPAVAMMFVAAVQGGDLQNWLGERTIDTLRRIGKADVIGRLSRDGAALARMNAAEPGAQDWRSLPVPMLWDNHVHKIFLHYRHDRERGENGDDKKNGTRFVLDLRPARMGDVQLDGLHRAGTDKGRLDLIVRTRENISPPMQQAMRRLYTHALEQAALSGELSFQHRADGWVRVKTG